MPRTVDTLPTPKSVREKKVIVLSYGRNGTLGLYRALDILGYHPYHLVTAFTAGATHLRLIREGMAARMDGDGKPYGREEFDKWFADYGAIVDVSAFFVEELVAAYPDAKFILTYRDPDAWLRSVRNTFIPLEVAQRRFPIWHMSFVDPFTRQFLRMTQYFQRSLWGAVGPDSDERNGKALERYQRHNELVRSLVPKEKLLEVKLEDGLDWEQICPFLGVEVPDVPYPRANDPKEFRATVQGIMATHWRRTLVSYAAALAPVVGVGVWYLRQKR